MIHQLYLKPNYTNKSKQRSTIISLDQNLILKIQKKPRSSKTQSFNKFSKVFDLPDTGTVYGSPTSSIDKSNLPLHFTQSQASKEIPKPKLLEQLLLYLFVLRPRELKSLAALQLFKSSFTLC